jgi:tRNA-Thr(GGU) m(6)t(6)A37 methyltransferase TsaA
MQLQPIGTLYSDFKEKFGVPRQSSMVPAARGILKLNPHPHFATALQHLEGFSHVWIVFGFDQHAKAEWTPTIRPPRLDAPGRIGVFASRSPDRPNPIGISAVKLEAIRLDAPGGIEIELSGIDLLDQTPVYDIKPYLPFSDSIPSATSGWAASDIPKYSVQYAPGVLEPIRNGFETLLTQILEWDPRPTSQRESMPISDPKNEGREFKFRLAEYDIHWKIQNGGIWVIGIQQ